MLAAYLNLKDIMCKQIILNYFVTAILHVLMLTVISLFNHVHYLTIFNIKKKALGIDMQYALIHKMLSFIKPSGSS